MSNYKKLKEGDIEMDFREDLLKGLEDIDFSVSSLNDSNSEIIQEPKTTKVKEKLVAIDSKDKIDERELKDMHSLVNSLSEYMIYQYFRPVYILRKLSEGKINSFYYGLEEKKIKIGSDLKKEIEKILALFFGKDEKGNLVGRDIFLGVTLLTQCSIFTAQDKNKKIEHAVIESLRILLGTITIGAKNAQNQICNTLTYLQSGLKSLIENDILSPADKAVLEDEGDNLILPLKNNKRVEYNKNLSLHQNFIDVRQQVEKIVLDAFRAYAEERKIAEKIEKNRNEEIKEIIKKDNGQGDEKKEIFIQADKDDLASEAENEEIGNSYKL